MADGGKVGKSWRVREAMGDSVPEANTTACACCTTCTHNTAASTTPTLEFSVLVPVPHLVVLLAPE